MDTYRVQYRLTFPDGGVRVFDLEFDEESFELHGDPVVELPTWTELEFEKCSHCPLSTETHPHCPVATSILSLVVATGELVSHDRVDAEVRLPGRAVTRKDITAQQAISSLMGLLIPTCGCPHTAYFRPMARFHLPFSDGKETVYRAVSMFLLAQYLKSRSGVEANLDLEGLKEIYRNMNLVNQGIGHRLRVAGEKDSSLNALVVLDMFTMLLPATIDYALEEEVASYFRSYLEGGV